MTAEVRTMDGTYDNACLETGVAPSGGVALCYESAGRGPAVLLVAGFGATRRAWARTVPILTRRFRVLSFDNRGMGDSEGSLWPYSARGMADDAVAVLDAAGERRAHVYGISLGGMVAQEIALRHPERVAALVLAATTPGGPRAVPGETTALTFFARCHAMGREEAAWAAVPYLYGERTRRRRPQRIAEDIARHLPHGTDAVSHAQQLLAAASHSTLNRLAEIRAPTLVVHGDGDAIVPAANARLIADAIPRAELSLWPGAGHLFTTDEPRADRTIARFLWRHTERPERRAVPRTRRWMASMYELLARAA
jgi:3-oxoadipate enol-lactonase